MSRVDEPIERLYSGEVLDAKNAMTFVQIAFRDEATSEVGITLAGS